MESNNQMVMLNQKNSENNQNYDYNKLKNSQGRMNNEAVSNGNYGTGPIQSTRQFLDYEDKALLKSMVNLHNSLSRNVIDVNEFKNAVDLLNGIQAAQKNDYLESLLNPEVTGDPAKIPSMMPIPSTAFKLRNSFNVNVNASGNAVLVFNPYYLGDVNSPILSSAFLNNDATLTLGGPNNNFNAIDVGQSIQPVYDQYRLVSGSIVINYFGQFNEMSGYVGGAILYDRKVGATALGGLNADLQKYGNQNLMVDSTFHHRENVIEGLRQIYFPLDNSFEEYAALGQGRNGFAFATYIGSAPPNSSFRVDISLNYECLPSSDFLNYIPTTLSNCYNDSNKRDEAVREASRRPVTSAVEAKTQSKRLNFGNIFSKLITKVGPKIPGILEIGSKILGSIL